MILWLLRSWCPFMGHGLVLKRQFMALDRACRRRSPSKKSEGRADQGDARLRRRGFQGPRGRRTTGPCLRWPRLGNLLPLCIRPGELHALEDLHHEVPAAFGELIFSPRLSRSKAATAPSSAISGTLIGHPPARFPVRHLEEGGHVVAGLEVRDLDAAAGERALPAGRRLRTRPRRPLGPRQEGPAPSAARSDR
jgi:hypothetical protein